MKMQPWNLIRYCVLAMPTGKGLQSCGWGRRMVLFIISLRENKLGGKENLSAADWTRNLHFMHLPTPSSSHMTKVAVILTNADSA